ncbi:MAG: acetyltransferase [Acidobacteria bacterium]|nr:acetyltransferase [Acidobacteriota bacterium]
MAEPINIRPCESIAEFDQITDLEQRIWQTDARDATPGHIALIATKTGGQVLGAFAGDEMIGFSLAFVAQRAGQTYLHSHEVGVVEAWQNAGVGFQLKLAQRQDALARGFTLMEWTFDPLAVRNAWFNVMKLGAVMRRFIPNLYGVTTSALHGGLPTDRLVAEWHLNAPRVQAACEGKPPALSADAVSIAVPLNLPAEPTALALQAHIRREFEERFAAGYVVTGLEKSESATAYLLQQGAP